MRMLLSVGALLAMGGSAGAVAAPVSGGGGNLVLHQQSDGGWGEMGFTGECVAGLATAYRQSGATSYLTAAQKGANYCLYDEGGYSGGVYSYGLFASGAYGLARLAQIDPDHGWGDAVRNFYGQIHDGGGTQDYINAIVSPANLEVTSAVYDLARHSVATFLVGAADAGLFRSNLVTALGRVKNSSDAPVMALGAAVWALGQTGTLGSEVVSTVPTSFFYNVPLSDLPGMLVSHQAPDGSFYARFDNTSPGFTETTAMATMGVISAGMGGGRVRTLRALPVPRRLWVVAWMTADSRTGRLATSELHRTTLQQVKHSRPPHQGAWASRAISSARRCTNCARISGTRSTCHRACICESATTCGITRLLQGLRRGISSCCSPIW